VPLVGEPTASDLAEARLVPATCANDPKTIDARIAQMRAEVNAELKRWHEAQPACWHDYRMLAESGTGTGQGFGYGHGRLGRSHRATPPRVRMGGSVARRAESASGTNNQVAGVDEADMVKTDGAYVYLVVNGALRILEAMNPRVLSVTSVPGVARELFVEGDRAVVYSSIGGSGRKPCKYGYDCKFAGDGTSTQITVFDVADREAPKPVRKIELSGSLMASRRIGTAVHTVVADGDDTKPLYQAWPPGMPICGTTEAVVVATYSFAKIARASPADHVLATYVSRAARRTPSRSRARGPAGAGGSAQRGSSTKFSSWSEGLGGAAGAVPPRYPRGHGTVPRSDRCARRHRHARRPPGQIARRRRDARRHGSRRLSPRPRCGVRGARQSYPSPARLAAAQREQLAAWKSDGWRVLGAGEVAAVKLPGYSGVWPAHPNARFFRDGKGVRAFALDGTTTWVSGGLPRTAFSTIQHVTHHATEAAAARAHAATLAHYAHLKELTAAQMEKMSRR
jgi:hypothetical protein